MAQNSGAPRSQEDYITQVSEEIEGRVTKRLSKEFSRTGDLILGALARLDNFLMNPLLPGRSGTTPEPTRNVSHNNQGTNEDGSQNDPHPEAGPSYGQTSRNVSLEEDHDSINNTLTFKQFAEFNCFSESSFVKADSKQMRQTITTEFLLQDKNSVNKLEDWPVPPKKDHFASFLAFEKGDQEIRVAEMPEIFPQEKFIVTSLD